MNQNTDACLALLERAVEGPIAVRSTDIEHLRRNLATTRAEQRAKGTNFPILLIPSPTSDYELFLVPAATFKRVKACQPQSPAST